MRSLVLMAFVLFLFVADVGPADAQTSIVGLPEVGVVLTGYTNAPVIQNGSGRKILGYALRFEDAAGHGIVRLNMELLALRNGNPNAGIASGSQRNYRTTVDVAPPGGTGPAVKVSLDSVLFADGEVVGPDSAHSFETITASVTAERDLDQAVLAIRNRPVAEKVELWVQLRRMAEGNSTKLDFGEDKNRLRGYRARQKVAALELINIFDTLGEDAAYELAERTSVYPTIWRKQ